MFCGKCGTQNADNSEFCTNCGAKLKRSNSEKRSLTVPAQDDKNKKIGIIAVVIIAVIIIAIIRVFLFGRSDKPSDLLIGTWVSAYGSEIVEFMDDGSCTAPFTYSASWLESAERYTVKDDGTLLLSSIEGHTDCLFNLVESAEEALDDRGTYFVSEDTLIIDGDEYTKTE